MKQEVGRKKPIKEKGWQMIPIGADLYNSVVLYIP